MKKEVFARFYLKYKFIIFPMTVALSSLFLIIFAIYPQTARLINNQTAAVELLNRSKLLETKVAALESYDIEGLTRKVGSAMTVFPADKDFGNILGLLNQSTAGTGFTISAVTLGSSGNKLGNSDSFEIKLDVSGSRGMFPVFLSNLENSSRLIRINTIDVSSKQASESIEAVLIVAVLYSMPPQNFGTPDSPLPAFSREEEELMAALPEVRSTAQASASAETPSRGRSNPFE